MSLRYQEFTSDQATANQYIFLKTIIFRLSQEGYIPQTV